MWSLLDIAVQRRGLDQWTGLGWTTLGVATLVLELASSAF